MRAQSGAPPGQGDQALIYRVLGYGLAAIGPVAVSATSFVLAFGMLRLESPAAFGTFSFLFSAALFSIAVAAALFAAPLQALFLAGREMTATVVAAATLVGLVAGMLYVLLGLTFGLSAFAALCYGLFGMLTMLRTVGRAWRYAAGPPWRVALSDGIYSVVTLGVFAIAVWSGGADPLAAVWPALAAGTAVATVVIGREFLSLVLHARFAALASYRSIWRDQSRWSLLGVAANEAASNAHIYLLALLNSTTAVAPVAASALLMRPINVVQNALVDYERARLVRALSHSGFAVVARSLWTFRAILLLVWGGTVALAAAVLLIRPSLVIPASYDLSMVAVAVGLWAVVWFVIVVQVPQNVLLQAADRFASLARAGVCAAIVSVSGMLIAITANQPLWTIAALVPGWIVGTVIVGRAVGNLRREALTNAADQQRRPSP